MLLFLQKLTDEIFSEHVGSCSGIGPEKLAQRHGVESNFSSPKPSIYESKRVVVRIKHSPPATRLLEI